MSIFAFEHADRATLDGLGRDRRWGWFRAGITLHQRSGSTACRPADRAALDGDAADPVRVACPGGAARWPHQRLRNN